MRVQISVPGTFHAFKLGRQLEQRNALERIYTMQPSFKVNEPSIPDEKVSHIIYPNLFLQLGHQVPILNDILPSRWNSPLSRWASISFDRSVSRHLNQTEDGIFLGFAGNTLSSLHRAKELNLTTAVERSSVHIRHQKKILDNEYQQFNQGKSPISEDHVLREEKEYNLADYIVTPSTFVLESFLARGFSEEKIICTPIGIDVEEYASRVENQADSGKINFLFVGSVGLQKGIPHLLEAWDSVNLRDARLLIAGHISKNVRNILTEYESDDSVEFLGWVENIQELYQHGSALILPSVHDGFGMVVTEAMASGLPVIVSENTGAKDCVRDGTDGLIVPIRDSERLAEAIEFMYNNPEKRKRMGKNARENIASKYTEDDYGERIFSAYQAMIAR